MRHACGRLATLHHLGYILESHALNIAQMDYLTLPVGQAGDYLLDESHLIAPLIHLNYLGRSLIDTSAPSPLPFAQTIKRRIAYGGHHQRAKTRPTQQQTSPPQAFIKILNEILGLGAVAQQSNGIAICRILNSQKLYVQLLAIHPRGNPLSG